MTRKQTSRGFSLVELLISIAIGLILAAAASYLFVSTQRISKVIDTKAQQQETAGLVFDFIGRDLKNAGFFPAAYPTTAATTNVLGAYSNVVDSTQPAYDQGIYGCSQGVFNPTTATCPTATTGEPDSLVVNYFSSDNFTLPGVGTRRDCLRQTVDGAIFNSVKYNEVRSSVGATYTTTVALPVFISNIYSLGSAKTLAVDRQSTSTRSFRCSGNGNTAVHQPMFPGVEQLRIKYGVADGTTLEAPALFYTASGVTALASVSINGDLKTGWQRVVAVQVCVLTKTLDNSARQVSAQGSYTDCDGTTITYSASDRSLYERQTRVFGVRNNLTATF